MTDGEVNEKRRIQAAEFPETMELLQRIRNALAAQVFITPISASKEREELYLRVQTLDAMQIEMAKLLEDGAEDAAIKAYSENLAKGEP